MIVFERGDELLERLSQDGDVHRVLRHDHPERRPVVDGVVEENVVLFTLRERVDVLPGHDLPRPGDVVVAVGVVPRIREGKVQVVDDSVPLKDVGHRRAPGLVRLDEGDVTDRGAGRRDQRDVVPEDEAQVAQLSRQRRRVGGGDVLLEFFRGQGRDVQEDGLSEHQGHYDQQEQQETAKTFSLANSPHFVDHLPQRAGTPRDVMATALRPRVASTFPPPTSDYLLLLP